MNKVHRQDSIQMSNKYMIMEYFLQNLCVFKTVFMTSKGAFGIKSFLST